MRHTLLTLSLLLTSCLLATSCGKMTAPSAQTATPAAESSQALSVSIEGMTCDHCVQSITTELLKTPGVTACAVSLDEKSAQITFAAEQVSPETIVAGINKLGYQAKAQ